MGAEWKYYRTLYHIHHLHAASFLVEEAVLVFKILKCHFITRITIVTQSVKYFDNILYKFVAYKLIAQIARTTFHRWNHSSRLYCTFISVYINRILLVGNVISFSAFLEQVIQ